MKMTTNYKDYSQHQKILTLMCRHRDKQWWLPQDFMLSSQGDLFVGYEASARLSELARRYPDMIESKQAGKYMSRRIRFETLKLWLDDLPKDLRYIFHRAGLTHEKPIAPSQEQVAAQPKQYQETFAMCMTSYLQGYTKGESYQLKMERLRVGKPLVIVKPYPITYPNFEGFKKDWKPV